MSKGGERVQGMAGGPVMLGGGRGPTTVVADFAHPNERLKLRRYSVVGITKTGAGVPVGGATVEVFETVSKLPRGGCVSDANGNYLVDVNDPDVGLTFFANAYKAGAPDLAGTTVNTLIGIEQ